MHGGDIYQEQIEYDFSVNINPNDSAKLLKPAYDRAICRMNNYPDINQRYFCSKISMLEKVSSDQVLGGNGASELFLSIVRALAPKKALVLGPSFSGYKYVLDSLGNCLVVNYYLKEDKNFGLDKEFISFLDGMSEKPDVVFLANPNNPTGRAIDEDLLEMILKRCRESGINLIVDECFLKLTKNAKSLKPQVKDFPNLYVVDAFTKLFSIPGARVGYLCSQRQNIEKVKAQLPEWNFSILGQELGCQCAEILMEEDFKEKSLALIENQREFLIASLGNLGIKVFPSDANYLLIESKKDLFLELKKQGILIRDCSDYEGLKKSYYRIAVKGHEENLKLIEAISKIVEV